MLETKKTAAQEFKERIVEAKKSILSKGMTLKDVKLIIAQDDELNKIPTCDLINDTWNRLTTNNKPMIEIFEAIASGKLKLKKVKK